MVEAAIVIPMLLLLMVGMIYFYLRVYNQIKTIEAARILCWQGSGNYTDTGITPADIMPTNAAGFTCEITYNTQGIGSVPGVAGYVTKIVNVLSIIPGLSGIIADNPIVTATYHQKPMPFGVVLPPKKSYNPPPGSTNQVNGYSNAVATIGFLYESVTNKASANPTITVATINKNYMKTVDLDQFSNLENNASKKFKDYAHTGGKPSSSGH